MLHIITCQVCFESVRPFSEQFPGTTSSLLCVSRIKVCLRVPCLHFSRILSQDWLKKKNPPGSSRSERLCRSNILSCVLIKRPMAVQSSDLVIFDREALSFCRRQALLGKLDLCSPGQQGIPIAVVTLFIIRVSAGLCEPFALAWEVTARGGEPL